MNKTLVVFYSRSGYTRKIAELLARALNADVDEIREPRGRTGGLGYLRSVYEVLRGARPPILQPRHHPHAYERIVIGTPVWARHISSPVRSYLTRHQDDLKHVAYFCTYGGRGAEQVLNEMAQLLDRAPQATLSLTDREVYEGSDAKIAPFVKVLLSHR